METRSRKRAEEAEGQGALTRGKISRLRLTPATVPKLESNPSRETRPQQSATKSAEKTASSRRRRSTRLKPVSDEEGGKSNYPMDHNHASEGPGEPEGCPPKSEEIERPTEPASERDREKERNREREREQLKTLRERAAAVMGLEDLEGDGGMLPHNMASASNALNGLLRKLGAGIDDLLPPSSSISMQNSRFRQILNGLRADGEPGRQLESLNELCELLSIGTEDSLSTFSVEAFVPVLVTLLNCEHNPDMMLLAARALTHLCDVLPSSCAAVVHHGAVQCFCARLLTIEYIDLAEQSLQALEKVSHEHPTACLRSGGLMAVLSFLEFFSTGVQRVAVTTAANICRQLPPDSADLLVEAVPLLQNLLTVQDSKVVEQVCVCLARIADAFATQPDALVKLCTQALISEVATFISVSSGGQTPLSPSTYAGMVRLLAVCASGTPSGAETLLHMGISGVVRDILVGTTSLSRPAEQVAEIVSLVNELLPPLPDAMWRSGPSVPGKQESSAPRRRQRGGEGGKKEEGQAVVSPREEMLREQPMLLARFGTDLFPVLLQVYAATVSSTVRHKCLTGMTKLIHFSSREMLLTLLDPSTLSSFVAEALGCRDPSIVLYSLQVAEMLMQKLPDVFRKAFIKEGVVHAVDLSIAGAQPLVTSQPPSRSRRGTSSRRRGSAGQAEDGGEETSPAVVAAGGGEVSGKVRSSLSGAVLAKAQLLKATYFPNTEGEGDASETESLVKLREAGQQLKAQMGGEENLEVAVAMVKDILKILSEGEGVSTFEFIGSGVVEVLLDFFNAGQNPTLASEGRWGQEGRKVLKAFVHMCDCSWMLLLVRKLQGALASLERFHVVVTVAQRSGGPSGLNMLAQPFKLRLVRAASDSQLRDYSATVVHIEPLAMIGAVEDFLWARVKPPGAAEAGSSSRQRLGWGATPAATGTESMAKQVMDCVLGSDPIGEEEEEEEEEDDMDAEEHELELEQEEEGEEEEEEEVEADPEEEEDELCAVAGEQVDVGGQSAAGKEVDGAPRSFAAAVAGGGEEGVGGKRGPKLVLSMGGVRLERNMTIFQAVQRHATGGTPDFGSRRAWEEVYTLTYARPGEEDAPSPPKESESAAGESSVDPNKEVHHLLLLLRVLEGLNRLAPRLQADIATDRYARGEEEKLGGGWGGVLVPAEEFVSAKLTPKLMRQMQDALALCSGGVPEWCHHLTQTCPFLFPFPVRCHYFYSTSFGLGRALQRLQHQHSAETGRGEGRGGREGRELRVSRLQRSRVQVDRDDILNAGVRVMEAYCSSKTVLEVEYDKEVGTGLGPTLEFYTLLSRELQKRSLQLWRRGDGGSEDMIPVPPSGLFPRPWHPSSPKARVVECFLMLGRVMGKALQDNRLLDLPLSLPLYKLLLGHNLDLFDIKSFEPELGATLEELQACLKRSQAIQAGQGGEFQDVTLRGCAIEDLGLTFVLPGYPEYELKAGGANVTVCLDNLEEYIESVVDATLKSGITPQVAAMRAGYNQVSSLQNLQIFREEEMEVLLCGRREQWTRDMLVEHLKFDHGYSATSPPMVQLVEIMEELSAEEQRAFLQFVTGAPRLPTGGLAALSPKLTIVRKHTTGGAGSLCDRDLPSVMTCANYLKVPPYTNKEVMKQRLLYAISEGQGRFDLS